MEKYLINPNQKISRISKDIYGHFSEHLGRCIYEGLYVGEHSDIPNVNGMRTDGVEAIADVSDPEAVDAMVAQAEQSRSEILMQGMDGLTAMQSRIRDMKKEMQ